jgi:hypothetical protein
MKNPENEALPVDDFRERMIRVVREFAGTRYSYLEERTGISARKWKNMCNRVQQPTVEMVIAIAKERPYFLSWLIFGEASNIFQASLDDPEWSKKLLNALMLK